MEMIDFRNHLAGATLAITGEGSLDEQTLHGKAAAGVGAAARDACVPVVAVAGRMLLSPSQAGRVELRRTWDLTDLEPDESLCMTNAPQLLTRVGTLIYDEYLPAEAGKPIGPAGRDEVPAAIVGRQIHRGGTPLATSPAFHREDPRAQNADAQA